MSLRVDLRGMPSAGRWRRLRACRELMALAAALPGHRLQVLACGDDAYAARLAVGPGTTVTCRDPATDARRVYRAFGEACPAPPPGVPALVEALDLGRLADDEAGPGDDDRVLEQRLRALAEAEAVTWRIAAEWQAAILRTRLGIPRERLAMLPAAATLPGRDRLCTTRPPRGLPLRYLLCLTPVGDAGDLLGLVAAHAHLGRDAPCLAVAGVDDERWIPVVRQAVADAGSRGRVLLLRDLDPVAEAAAIARAEAVVAVDRHPAHAVRLRLAAALGRPAVIRRHAGFAQWVGGGCWFDDGTEELAAGLAAPEPIHAVANPVDDAGGLAGWLSRDTGARRRSV